MINDQLIMPLYLPLNIDSTNDGHSLRHGHVWAEEVAIPPIYLCQKLCHQKTSDLFQLYAFGSSAEATAANNRSLEIILKTENVAGHYLNI